MIIGLTGSIASGKTTVAKIFEILGCKVFYSDEEAKKLYYDKNILSQISEATNTNFIVDGTEDTPDFKKISDFVFESSENSKKVTDILYKYLDERFDEWVKSNADENILMIEAAMLFESGFDKKVDLTICVYADKDIRIERIRSRNGADADDYIKRITYQLDDEKKLELADFVINNSEHKALLEQVIDIYKHINALNSIQLLGHKIIKNNQICKLNEYLPNNKFIYEVIRLVNGEPRFSKEHYERMVFSLKSKNIEDANICSYENFYNNIKTLSSENGIYNNNVKIVADFKDTYFILIKSKYPTQEFYKKGADVSVVTLTREDPNVKQINRSFRDKADAIIEENNVFETLIVNKDGFITEGSRSNVFFIKNNVVYTAPDDLVLKGITRLKVIEAIKNINIPIVFQPIKVEDIKNIDGAFLTGTSIDVLKINLIQGESYREADNLIDQISKSFLELI
ncbi:MAG: dephospho-CoA kinase [Bacteroidales bacterium]|jgi:branched-chain amino acid aminotransferase